MKRKRFWIFIALAAVLLGGAGAYVGDWLLMRRRAETWRQQGVAAAIVGDNDRAAKLLLRYLQARPHDKPENYEPALRYYANSRELSESNNGQNLIDALAAMKQLVTREGFNHDDERHLLELEVKLEQRPDALDVANLILSKTGNQDVRALELKTQVLTKLLRYREALETADVWISKAPQALAPYMARFSLRHQLQNSGDALVDEASKLRDANPNDPRFELLEGYAYSIWSNEPNVDGQVRAERHSIAAKWLKTAANHKGLSDEFIQALVEQFDGLDMFDDAVRMLEALAKAGASPAVHHTLATRLWELAEWDQAAAELSDVDPNDSKSDATLLALKAIALSNIGRKPQSDACRQALAARTNQAPARAWVLLLRQIIDAARVDSKQVVVECRSALTIDPTNSYLAYYLGDAQARIGDLDPAIQTWLYTCRINLTWPVPPTRLVDALIQRGRTEDALAVAYNARQRSPNSAAPVLAQARAWAIGVDTGVVRGSEAEDKLFALANLVQSQLPGEDTTLMIQIELLAKDGKKDQAAGIIKTALARTPVAAEPLLLRLAALSRRYGLGLEMECFTLCEKAHGITPDLAYAEAISQAFEGRADAGLNLFDSLAAKVGRPTEQRWRLARAKYLDATSNPEAKAAWIELGDSFPDKLDIQQAAVNARCVRGDWDFQLRTIDRMRLLTGEKALGWRLARARLMVETPRNETDVETGSVKLIDLLKEYDSVPEPHVLLAQALIKMNRIDGAIDHLSTAARLDPSSVPIALQLAGLCQSKGDFDRARKEIERVMPSIRTSEQRHAAATLLARQGNDDAALKILENPPATSGGAAMGDEDDLLLATIYRQRHQNDKVDAVLHKLLEKPDVPTIEFAASFYASVGRKADAIKALGLLDNLQIKPGMKEMVWGRYCASTGDLPGAIAHYQAATSQAPDNASAWQLLAVCDAEAGHIDDALAVFTAGHKAVLGDKALAFAFKPLRSDEPSEADLLKQIGSDHELDPLAVLILRDPVNGNAAAGLLTIMLQERQSDDVQHLASRLQQFADDNPDFLPGRLQLIQCLLSMNRPIDALGVAQRAVAAFPTSAEPAEVATRICLSNHRWDDATTAAETWRKRSLDNPLPADLAIAEALLGQGRNESVLTELIPYQQAAALEPDKYAELIKIRSIALVRAGRADEAVKTLWPLAQKSQPWQILWLEVAAQLPDRHEAVRWADRVGEIIPSTALAERGVLARVYNALGTELADAKLTSLASEMYTQLAADPKAPANLLAVAASHAERHGDLTSAESLYRRAIQLDPTLWMADNNLAMLIINRGGDPKEAAQFAAAAARLKPRQPDVLDTLAEAQRKTGDLKAAADSEHAAARLDPDNVKWKIRLAQYLLDGGNLPEAEKVVQDIENDGGGLAQLPAADQQALSAQFAAIQKRITGSKSL